MKRRAVAIFLVLSICIMLGGCDFWMDGTRTDVVPHQGQYVQTRDEIVTADSYEEMKNTLNSSVEVGASGGVISAPSMDSETARAFMVDAVEHIMTHNPICAYAVKDITYDVGVSKDSIVVAYQINYHHGRSEILRIKHAATMDEATRVITAALDNCDASVVLRIEKYEALDFTQLVQNYGNNNPDVVMEIPTVSFSVYPESGSERVVAISFTYQTSREDLREMRERVEPVFTSAELYVQGATQVGDIYSQLYSFLVERYDYTYETSITPTYSLLLHGVGDSRSFANVYSVMCRNAGLDCKVISGTRNGVPWCWNLVRIRGGYYHVDLIGNNDGEFAMLNAEEMDGYVWDYSAYETY